MWNLNVTYVKYIVFRTELIQFIMYAYFNVLHFYYDVTQNSRLNYGSMSVGTSLERCTCAHALCTSSAVLTNHFVLTFIKFVACLWHELTLCKQIKRI
jgi:hypothetical protein